VLLGSSAAAEGDRVCTHGRYGGTGEKNVSMVEARIHHVRLGPK
jgi:hypothetical protein